MSHPHRTKEESIFQFYFMPRGFKDVTSLYLRTADKTTIKNGIKKLLAIKIPSRRLIVVVGHLWLKRVKMALIEPILSDIFLYILVL